MIHTAEQIAAFAAATEAEQLIIKNAVDKLIFGAGSFEATVAKVEANDEPIPAVSEAQARKQMEWRNMGQKDGTKSHLLFFFESEKDKGTGAAMNRGEVSLYPGASGWKVEDGDGTSYKSLADAKKAAIDRAIPILQDQGYILKPAQAATVAKIEATISPIFTDADRAELATQTFAEHVAAELDTTAEDAQIEVCGYTGPMLRLRERLTEGAYKKAANGQPCCGDRVATLLGALTPAQVIRACIVAMALPANPYTHLNVGQQSMNLRNKLRGCFKREEFGFGVLVEAVEQVKEEVATAE